MSNLLSASRSSQSRASSRGTITPRRVIRNPCPQGSPDDSFSNTIGSDEGFSISAIGDLSMSEAYNVPAPTTGDYPLKLKRTRPPKPGKLRLTKDSRRNITSNLVHQLCQSSLNQQPLSPASDFRRFVEGLQSAKVASPFSCELVRVAQSRRTIG